MREEKFNPEANVIRFICAICSKDLDIASLGVSKTWLIRIKKCDCEEE